MSETGLGVSGNEQGGLLDESGRRISSRGMGTELEPLVRYVREHPVCTALSALAIGYILGKLT